MNPLASIMRYLVCVFALTLTFYGHAQVVPGHVFARLQHLEMQIEILAAQLKSPNTAQQKWTATEVAPREVYFQAQTLLKKINKLALEHGISRFPPVPTALAKDIRPDAVYKLVSQADAHLQTLMQKHQLKSMTFTPREAPDITPDQVFSKIQWLNHKLNNMLMQPITLSDVHQRVTLALRFSTALAKQLQLPLPFTPKALPGITHQQLLPLLVQTFSEIQRIAQLKKVPILKLSSVPQQHAPAALYDFSSLIVSELAYFSSLYSSYSDFQPEYQARAMSPSDIYLVIEQLKRQLQIIRLRLESRAGQINIFDEI